MSLCVCVSKVTGAHHYVYRIIRPLRASVLNTDCTLHVICKGIIASIRETQRTQMLGGLQERLTTIDLL